MQEHVKKLFERYESFFNRGLAGEASMGEAAELYAPEFIAASPAGVMTGKNDDQLKTFMEQGFGRYRAMETRSMRMRDIHVSPIDEAHCLARVAWTATFARAAGPDASIDFDVCYLVQALDGRPKVFGWISGDEQALLKRHGIV